MRRHFFVLALAVAIPQATYGAGNSGGTSPEPATKTSLRQADTMKIKLKIKDTVLTATLTDSKTTQDFVSLLPMTLAMNDLFGREKFGYLPRALSEEAKRTHSYEIGEVVYWSPGPDLAIYYRQDRQTVPDPGIIVIGKIDSGVEALNVEGSVKVTIELASLAANQTEAGVTPDALPPVPTLEDLRMVAPAFAKYTEGPLLEGLWNRPDLSPRDRSIITVSALIAKSNDRDALPF